jgi:HK97 gp10 family phage protein
MSGGFMKIWGLEQTIKNLRALPRELGSKGGGPVRRALAKATQIIRDDAERRAPFLTGNLKQNVYMYRDRNPQASGATERYLVMVRAKKRKYGDTTLNRRLRRVGKSYNTRGDAFYWWFLEFGTSKMPAQPYMRPAFETNKHAAVDLFGRSLFEDVQRLVSKMRKQ